MCLILVVRGARFYNDSITSAFRAQAARVDHSEFSMAYIDEEKQGRFIGSLQRSQVEWKNCHNGERPRSVSVLLQSWTPELWTQIPHLCVLFNL